MSLDEAEVQELMTSDDILIIEEVPPINVPEPPPDLSTTGDIDISFGANSAAEAPYGITTPVQSLDVSDDNVSGMTVCINTAGYDICHDDLPTCHKVPTWL